MRSYALRPVGWTLRLTLLVLMLGGYVLLATVPARAAGADESTPSYVVNISVARDGVTHIAERITYDFGSTPHHGIIRYIPVSYDYPPKPGYNRVLEISNVKVTSDAPDGVKIEHSQGNFVIRIGDSSKTITGVHAYTLDYDVRGALNRFADHVQLDWNALGTQWDAPVTLATVAVRFPVAVSSVVCFSGPAESRQPCTSATIKDGVVHVKQKDLDTDEGVTVSVTAPPGAVGTAAADPILKERWSAKKAFSITPFTVIGALLLAALGVVGVGALVFGVGRDRRFIGQTPGLTPIGGVGPTEREPLLDRTPIAVEFQPPDGLRPGQVGTLLDERVDPLDVSATIVDLAVRGYLRIEEQERAHWFASRDWTLVQLAGDNSKLLAYESLLLSKLFEKRTEVKVSELKQHFAPQMQAVKSAMYVDVVGQGFFRSSPQTVRAVWTFIGLAAVGVAVLATYLLARFTDAGLLGLGLFVGAVALLALAHRMPARTAKGRAALVKTLGFRQYLGTAEANQIKFEEKEDIFSRYLPYAMVFHETDHWAKVFASVGAGAAGGSAVAPALLWYVGPIGWDFGSLGDSLNSFAVTTGSAITSSAVSSGSGGASFSGGGFGGGGGGSW